MRQNCPVCFEYLFDSVRPTAVLPCGHTIHSDCLKEMERNRQLACPICMKSYADLAPVWRRMDEEARPGLLFPDLCPEVVRAQPSAGLPYLHEVVRGPGARLAPHECGGAPRAPGPDTLSGGD